MSSYKLQIGTTDGKVGTFAFPTKIGRASIVDQIRYAWANGQGGAIEFIETVGGDRVLINVARIVKVKEISS